MRVKNLNDLNKICERYDMKLYYKPDYEFHIKEIKILKSIVLEIYGMAVECEFKNKEIDPKLIKTVVLRNYLDKGGLIWVKEQW